ncbi:hypothetical protein [Streptomyces abikoensis]|uniref:hypothetical protein n=1 Tax=Streptomyces abikoensis TaxID=97398 RepID=UPI0016764C7E|nr:hypothetical protein [Streptomyces abikoensis]GGP63831.1 hypothetical protein GCM10010214_42170 [Streptomyces abikoensis]
MADIAGRAAHRTYGHQAADVLGDRPSPTRHPLVAAAMVLPLAVLLAVVFGGWDAVVTQASSVAGLLGR